MYSRQVPDYYKVLDVNKTATLKEIKYAYIKLAKKYHPDRNHNINEAEKIFKAIERAYSILSNPKERKKYDLFNFKTFKQDFKKNTRDFSVKKENYQKHNNTYNDYNDKEKS
ncbi:MAG: J domain-containing protein, partial [archaeon]|nr:J domain-containing protein [archaeon]